MGDIRILSRMFEKFYDRFVLVVWNMDQVIICPYRLKNRFRICQRMVVHWRQWLVLEMIHAERRKLEKIEVVMEPSFRKQPQLFNPEHIHQVMQKLRWNGFVKHKA